MSSMLVEGVTGMESRKSEGKWAMQQKSQQWRVAQKIHPGDEYAQPADGEGSSLSSS
jgi:hypothetical protein